MEAEEGKHKTKTLYIWGLDRSLAQTVVKEEFANFKICFQKTYAV